MGSKDHDPETGSEKQDQSPHSVGSLVVNEQGDLQYLGENIYFSKDSNNYSILICSLGHVGPASGIAVLSQATELLNNGQALHQQLHISEFDSSGRAQVRSDVPMPSKDVADKYIDGELHTSNKFT